MCVQTFDLIRKRSNGKTKFKNALEREKFKKNKEKCQNQNNPTDRSLLFLPCFMAYVKKEESNNDEKYMAAKLIT